MCVRLSYRYMYVSILFKILKNQSEREREREREREMIGGMKKCLSVIMVFVLLVTMQFSQAQEVADKNDREIVENDVVVEDPPTPPPKQKPVPTPTQKTIPTPTQKPTPTTPSTPLPPEEDMHWTIKQSEVQDFVSKLNEYVKTPFSPLYLTYLPIHHRIVVQEAVHNFKYIPRDFQLDPPEGTYMLECSLSL